MALGIRGINPIWTEFDLTGHLFDDNFWLYVLENTIPYIPSPVYHDVDLSIPWTDPIQFLANGTLPIDIFWDPTKVYRLEFRQNNGQVPPSQADALIYEVNDYVPGTGGSTPVSTVAFPTGNQVTNPQFALFNETTPITITVAGSYNIAPGWFLDLAGSGSATITQVPLTSINPTKSNAPYALHLVLSGWDPDSVILRQRFQQSGVLWANMAVACAITAATGSGFSTLSANLVNNLGSTIANVLSVPVVNTTLTEYTGHGIIGASTDTTQPPAAYVELQIPLSSNADMYLTSIQLIVENPAMPFEPSFTQDSIDRQIDYTFHYFQPLLNFKPIPSLLTGWDFPLNPAQFGSSETITTTAAYIWDQTICKSVVGNIAVIRNTVTGGFQATTANNDEAFYQIQYLTDGQAKKILGTPLSVNINAFRTLAGGVCNVKVYLFRGSSSATFPVLPTSLGTIDALGVFTLTAANWTLIPRRNLDQANGQLSTVDVSNYNTLNDVTDLAFNGWEITNATQISDTDKFAIVVTYSCPTTGTVVTVDSISVVPGLIPTRPAPQTFNQVLEECEYYFETSYVAGTAPGAPATATNIVSVQGADTDGVVTARGWATAFSLKFNTYKRTSPAVVLYSPDSGTANTVTMNVYTDATVRASSSISSTSWTIMAQNRSFDGIANTAADLVTGGTAADNLRPFGIILYHYKADARLGIV